MKKILQSAIGFACLTASAQTADTLFSFKMKLGGHSSNLETVAFSPDGKLLATGGWDRKVIITSLVPDSTYSLVKTTLAGPMAAINHLIFSPNGQYLAAASKDFSVTVWDLISGDKLISSTGNKDEVTHAEFSANSQFLTISSKDGTLRIYDVVNLADNNTLKIVTFKGPVNSFATVADGKSYIVATDKPTIEVISGAGTSTKQLAGHTDVVNCLDLSPNGKLLASGSNDKSVIIWDIAKAEKKFTLAGHGWKVTSVAWSADGSFLISTSNDGLTIVWDAELGTNIGQFKHMGRDARSAEISPDLKTIAVATKLDTDKHGAVLYNSKLSKKEAPKKPVKGTTAAAKGGVTKAPGGVANESREASQNSGSSGSSGNPDVSSSSGGNGSSSGTNKGKRVVPSKPGEGVDPVKK